MALELNGTTGVSLVQDGVITDANLPAGSVLQVVSTSSSTGMTVYADYPQTSGITASITPSSSSSKIFVIANIQAGVDNAGTNGNKIALYGIKNNTSSATFGNIRMSGNFNNSGADMFQEVLLTALDSPSSTSTQTYEILYGRLASSYNNGVSINGGGASPTSRIILMEIAA
jgi:hypothetical protein